MDGPPPHTVDHHIERATRLLHEAGCSNPRGDATEIVASALGIDARGVHSCLSREVAAPIAATITSRVERRATREPLAYITGFCEFRALRLAIDSRVLVPDDGGAALVHFAVDLPPNARVHDVGTGSGAIALAVKHERPDLLVSASDISPEAIDVARANAARLGVDVVFQVADGLPPGPYDLVIANLPYLETGETCVRDEEGHDLTVPPEYTGHMPSVAVFGGAGGLDVIRSFMRSVPAGTRLVLEHAPAQADTIRSFFADAQTLPTASDLRRHTIGHVH